MRTSPVWPLLLGGALLSSSCQDSQITRHNQPPTVEITWPLEGTQLRVDEPLVFIALAGDDFTSTPNLDVQWISSRAGVLEGSAGADDASVSLAVDALEEGLHEVSVEVMDGEGLTASDMIAFEVLPDAAPDVELLQPSQDGVYLEGDPIPVSLQVSDGDDDPLELELTWSGSAAAADLPGAPDSDGSAVGFLVDLGPGAWTLSVEVRDPLGSRASDSVAFTVEEIREPTSISLATASWRARGTTEEDSTGAALGTGDLTGDGVLDLVMASPSGTTSAPDDKEISVFAGPLGARTVTIEDADATVTAPLDRGLGYTLAVDQDLDGDGVHDLATGFYEQGDWVVLLFSGPLSGGYQPSDASAVLTSDSGPDSWFAAYGLDAVADITGDGMPDLVVGDPIAAVDAVTGAGAVLVWSAPLAGVLSEADAVARLISEPSEGAALGTGVASPGDLNGDGIGDLLAAAVQMTTTAQNAGEIVLVEGPVSGTLVASDVDAWIFGRGYCDYLGLAMAGAGDVDHDGTADWLAGAYFASRDQGEQGVAYLFTDVAAGASGDADDLATAMLLGEDAEDLAGNAVQGIGDLDGDGWDDFAVGAYREDSVGYDAGAVYVIPGPIEGSVDLGLSPWKLVGEYVNDEAGGALAAGELDGDGFPDLVVAAPMNDALASHGGTVYLVSGAALVE